ncbi:MAG TPA: hypothetical protein VK666_18705 [Chryseolinea sp.]|nr:hypothetical protein [Chryseolinea sp.]
MIFDKKAGQIKYYLMTLHDLIQKYKLQTKICYDIEHDDEATSAINNKAVATMYEIVEQVNKDFGGEGVDEFAKLLGITENDTYLWAAAQIMEKMQPDEMIRAKALKIIRDKATGDDIDALSFRYWLRDWEKKNA